MTESQAIRAAEILAEAGQFEAAEQMEHTAERARRQHFDDMAQRCYDDPDFADTYEADRREGF